MWEKRMSKCDSSLNSRGDGTCYICFAVKPNPFTTNFAEKQKSLWRESFLLPQIYIYSIWRAWTKNAFRRSLKTFFVITFIEIISYAQEPFPSGFSKCVGKLSDFKHHLSIIKIYYSRTNSVKGLKILLKTQNMTNFVQCLHKLKSVIHRISQPINNNIMITW